MKTDIYRYTLSNKSPSAWNFLSPAQAVTWRTVAVIIQVVSLSPYLCIRGISLSFVLPLTLRWVEAESLYKTNTVIKVNPTETMWSGVKRTMQETWPVLPPRNRDELWTLVSNAWDEVALSQLYNRTLMSPWRDEWNQWWEQKVLDFLLKRSISDNRPFKG